MANGNSVPVFSGNGHDLNLAQQKMVIIVIESPVAGGRTFDLRTCNNFNELTTEIYQFVSSVINGLPGIANSSIEDPVPGFEVRYFTQGKEQMYPQDGWEIFSAELDSINIKKVEPNAEEAPAPAQHMQKAPVPAHKIG